MRTVDLLATGAGRTLYQLTGAHNAESPTLILPQGARGVEIASGPLAVEQALQPVLGRVAPVQLAKKALLVMLGLIVVAIVFTTEVNKIVAFLPAVGLAAVAAMSGRCLNCHASGSTLSAIAPLLALAYLGLATLLFTLPVLHSKISYAGFLVFSGLIPATQAFMLVTEPKLCPACLAITFVSAAYFVAALKALTSSQLSGIAVPAWARAAIVVSLGLLLIRHSLVLSGRVSANEPPKEVIIPRIVGTSLSKFMSSAASFQPGTLYVVTQESCGACATAERDLSTMGLAWRKVPVCTMLANDGCFDGKSLTFVTPMLLICDADGRIVFQRNGWVASPQQLKELKAQIQTVQRGLQPKRTN